MFNILFVILNFLTIQSISQAFKYIIQFEDENLFKPCPKYPDKYIDKLIVLPKNITLLEDDNIFVKGEAIIVYDFKADKSYPFNIEFYKKQRGTWQKTIYTINRPDLCRSYFDPAEPWQTFVKEIPKEQQECPLYKGKKFDLEFHSNQEMKFTTNSMEGDYFAHFELSESNYGNEVLICSEAFFKMFRV